MYVTERDPHLLSDESPWIRRCCPNASEVGTTLERSGHDNEMQGLLCCQHNGRATQSVQTPKQGQLTPPPTYSMYILVSEQFIRFCKNTSLRGVPRIVKSKDRKLRILWTVFFLMFLIGCFVCVVMMVLQYLDRATMEKPVSRDDHPVDFPSITICNTRSFSNRGTELREKAGIMTYSEYITNLVRKLKKVVFKYKFTKNEQRYLSNAFLLSMYVQALPKSIKPITLGHLLNEMVLDCNVMLSDGAIKDNRLCHEVGTWVRTSHDLYLNCYTYTVTGESRSKKAVKVNMTIYLGGNNSVCQVNCNGLMSYLSQIDGARMQIHESHTYPNVNEGGIYLSPGRFTEIEFSTLIRQSKEPPYGSCKKNQPSNITLAGHLYRFSRSACFIREMQRRIYKNCGCFSSEHPKPHEYADRDIPYCRKVILSPDKSDDINKQKGMDKNGDYTKEYLRSFINNLQCKIRTTSEYETGHDGCPKRCKVLEYETSVSSTIWPTRSYQEYFLCDVQRMKDNALKTLCKTFLLEMEGKYPNASFDSRNFTNDRCVNLAKSENYTAVADLVKLFDDILRWRVNHTDPETHENITIREMQRMLRDEFFSDNFISLTVRRPHFGIKEIVEKEVITLTSLLSQVGGLLSIFIGLNFAFVVEIIELLYNIFQSIRQRKPQE